MKEGMGGFDGMLKMLGSHWRLRHNTIAFIVKEGGCLILLLFGFASTNPFPITCAHINDDLTL